MRHRTFDSHKKSGIAVRSKKPIVITAWRYSPRYGLVTYYITENAKGAGKLFKSKSGKEYVSCLAIITVKETGQKTFEYGFVSVSCHYGRFKTFKFTTNKGGYVW